MTNLSTKTIKEIALENPATTRIFQEFKIDFCCGGKRLFDDACAVAGADPAIVTQKIEEAVNVKVADAAETKSASELIDYITDKHHVFTRQEIERLSGLMHKVASRHGENHRELYAVQQNFQYLCEELMPHMLKEENVLFPYIKHLEMSAERNLSSRRPPFGSVNNPVRMMMFEHDAAGDLLKAMRTASLDYTLPEGVCMSYRALYFGLEEFEKDLHQHIHLENNVLFPLAIELEKQVFDVN